MKEANDQQQFNRNVEDIEVWLGEIEGQLMSEDYGKVRKQFCGSVIRVFFAKSCVFIHRLILTLIDEFYRKVIKSFHIYCL